jgi:DNA-binding transcriptional LysR family regulator
MDRLDCDRMFVAVMETGSFAAAAKRLGTSSGQASKLVSRLEAELGVRLINRTTRAISPTEVGQAYFGRIRSLLDELDAVDASVKSESGSPSGRLRITAPMTFGITQLAPVLHDFARQYPKIELDVSFSDRVVSLVDEGFDMAVRIGRPVDSGLVARKLCDVHAIAVAAETYLSAQGSPKRPEDLAKHSCIIDTNFREPFVWRFRDAAGKALAINVGGRLRFSNAEACLGASEAGLGIAYVPNFVAGASLAAGRVRPLLRDFAEEPFGIYVLYPPGRQLATKVRVLAEFLAARYRDTTEWDTVA